MKPVCCFYAPAAGAKALQALAEAGLRLSPQLALREGEALFLEAGRSRLLHSRESFEARLMALARRFECKGRLGWGLNAGEALARARHGGGELPLEALKDFASPFKRDEEIDTLLDPMLSALRGLGLCGLGAFLALPPRSLGERFGPGAAILRDRAAGDSSMAWPRFAPEPVLEESERLAGPEEWSCEDFERLLFGLKRALDRLAARLRGRSLRAVKIELRLKPEGGAWRLLDISLALPLAEPSQLLKVARERLECERREGRLRRGLTALALRLKESAPALSAQGAFFHSYEQECEAWNALINRLRAQLGQDEVFLAELAQRYLPERAWKRVIKEPAPSAGRGEKPLAEARRPSRLLEKPLPLLRHDQALAAGKRHWKALAWEGPERISGEWWGDGFDRDYFKVETEQESLWVYENAAAPQSLWLHGYFD